MYASEADAHAAIAPTGIAYRLAFVESVGKWDVAILSTYYVIGRAKPSHDWSKFAEVNASCLADAQDKAESAGLLCGNYSKSRVIASREWPAIQSRQHLRRVVA